MRLDKASYGLKHSGRAYGINKVSSATLVECGHEQYSVDPCVFRPGVADDVVAMMTFHVGDIRTAINEEVTKVIVGTLNHRFPTEHLGNVEWYMGSEHEGDREKGT